MPEEPLTPTDSVTVDLGDGKLRALRYSLGSMRRLKTKFGKSLLSQQALLSLDEDTIPDLLFEGLQDKQGLASSDDVAELMDTRHIKSILEAFYLAFAGSKPAKNAPAQTATPQTPSPTGSDSGPLPASS